MPSKNTDTSVLIVTLYEEPSSGNFFTPLVISNYWETPLWRIPGGNAEYVKNHEGTVIQKRIEEPVVAGRRELYEETGAVESDFIPLFIYCIKSDKGLSYGVQYFCNIIKLDDIPEFEMDVIEFHQNIPFEKLKTPKVHQQLYNYISEIIKQSIF